MYSLNTTANPYNILIYMWPHILFSTLYCFQYYHNFFSPDRRTFKFRDHSVCLASSSPPVGDSGGGAGAFGEVWESVRGVLRESLRAGSSRGAAASALTVAGEREGTTTLLV